MGGLLRGITGSSVKNSSRRHQLAIGDSQTATANVKRVVSAKTSDADRRCRVSRHKLLAILARPAPPAGSLAGVLGVWRRLVPGNASPAPVSSSNVGRMAGRRSIVANAPRTSAGSSSRVRSSHRQVVRRELLRHLFVCQEAILFLNDCACDKKQFKADQRGEGALCGMTG